MSRNPRRGDPAARTAPPAAAPASPRPPGDLFERLRADMGHLSKAFGRIAKYLVADPDSFMHAPLRTIAAGAGVSEPSIVRYCKSYGCRGVPEFRIELAKSLARELPEFRLNLIAPNVSDRERVNVNKKRSIARYAAGLIERERAIIIDSGSTLRTFATQLGEARGLSILTADLEVVNLLSRYKQHEVIVPAGTVRYDTMTIGGRFMERFLAELHFDTFFLGADAIDLRLGLSTFNEEEAQKNAAMIRASDRVVVLADSSKFGTPSLHRICDIRNVDVIVTDTDVDPTLVRQLEGVGVAVHCVDVRTGQRALGRRRARR
jgi:DeoR family transcriptional regulator, aga operon transcriptional repressor